MKKVLCLMLTAILCLSAAFPAAARVVITSTGSSVFEAPFTQSSGSIGVMVLVVQFSDTQFTEDSASDNIQSIFAGSGLNDVPSVKNYYEQASYGNLYMDIVVQRMITLDQPREYYEYNQNQLVLDCMSVLQDREVPLSSFDEDYNGYLDALYLVAAGGAEDSSSPWWPHTDIYYGGLDTGETLIGGCAFLSYELLVSGSSAQQYSAVHETGHLFGLTDYSEEEGISGTGAEVMMDLSEGDLDCFSKMLLGWTVPQVSMQTGSYRITSGSVTQDALLIAAENWDSNLMGEYYMVEYITPSGNQSSLSLDSDGAVRIWHIDAATSAFTNDVTPDMFENSNARDSSFKLIEVVEAEKEWYETGDSVSSSVLKFHDGTDAGLTIQIASMDGTAAVIEVRYGQPAASEESTSSETASVETDGKEVSGESPENTADTGESSADAVEKTGNEILENSDTTEEERGKILAVSVGGERSTETSRGNVQLRKLTVPTGICMAAALVICILLVRASRKYNRKKRRKY